MSSSVFFKFKSQKEPSRVTFDGTGISVFELKREIIVQNRLGDGTDFDLVIANQDTNEEYDDDTTIIPRSTYIIARRLPAIKQGRGTAARYVSGKMPTAALPNAGRIEKSFAAQKSGMQNKQDHFGNRNLNQQNGGPSQGGDAQSEEDKIAQMFAQSTEQWQQTQEKMATATPVYRGGPNQGGFKKNNPPVPAHPPPAGYICYRCGEKGHWIQACPTNSDPNYDGRPRVKRTTGIPRSFLKTVEKPLPPSANNGLDGQTALPQQPSAVMVNADGQFVIAEPDKASWDTYQLKANKSAARANQRDKELEERGIECSQCQKLYKDAVRTPCCEKTFCEECIQHQLLESDFICPICETKDVLLDQLVPDMEVRRKVDEYLAEKKAREAKEPPRPQHAPQQNNYQRGPMSQQSRPGPPMMGRPMMNPAQRPMPHVQPRPMAPGPRPVQMAQPAQQKPPTSSVAVAQSGATAPPRVATPPQAPATTSDSTSKASEAVTEKTAATNASATTKPEEGGQIKTGAAENAEGAEGTPAAIGSDATVTATTTTSTPPATDGAVAPKTPPTAPASSGASTPPTNGTSTGPVTAPSGPTGSGVAPVNPRKRPADDIPNAPRAPSAMRNMPSNQMQGNQHHGNVQHQNHQMHNNFQQQYRAPINPNPQMQFPYFPGQMGYGMPQQPYFNQMPMPPNFGMGAYGAPNPSMMFGQGAQMFMPPMFGQFPNQMAMPGLNPGGFNPAAGGVMPMNRAGGAAHNAQRPVKRVRQDEFPGMSQ